jgi:hypothetical protein
MIVIKYVTRRDFIVTNLHPMNIHFETASELAALKLAASACAFVSSSTPPAPPQSPSPWRSRVASDRESPRRAVPWIWREWGRVQFPVA